MPTSVVVVGMEDCDSAIMQGTALSTVIQDHRLIKFTTGCIKKAVP